MSHFTTIQTQIRDLDALRDACVELGFKFQQNAKCRGYAGITRLAPHVIQLKGPYDIAVDPAPENDGSYGLTTDWWDGRVAKEVGAGYGRLLQSYGVHKTPKLFFVDLPDALERAQIWDIVIKRLGRRPTDYDTVVLARACEQFTGAEIEAVFIDAMHEGYAEGREPGPKDILEAMTHTVPLANLMDGQIAALRHWAKGRAREAASRTTPARNSRRLAESN